MSTALARWGVFPPYAAAVEAAAVRNRWGDTSTPIVSSVILEISVPRFLVVSRPPVVEEIQRAFVGGLDLSRSGQRCALDGNAALHGQVSALHCQ